MPEVDDCQSNPRSEVETNPSGTTREAAAPGEGADTFESETPSEEPANAAVGDAASASTSANQSGGKSSDGTKPSTACKTFEEKLSYWSKKINAHMDSTFLAYLQVGKALRMAAAAFIAEGKTMKDFDRWVTESCEFNPTTASNYRRMSEFFHVTYPKILETVSLTYLRKLDFTVVNDLFAAWEAKKDGVPKYKLVVTWDTQGIYASIGDVGVPVDVREYTTRALKEKLKQSVKGNPTVPEAPKVEGTEAPQEPVTPKEADDSGGVNANTGPKKQVVGDNDRIKRLRSKYTVAVTKLNKERKELRQMLNEAVQRADELEAELEQLRAQTSAGKGVE